MIDGLKILIMRIVLALGVVIGAMPVYRYIYAYVTGTDPTYCVESLATIDMGVNMIYPITMLGIAIACFHVYYRAVQKRTYESTYQESGYYDPYSRT